MTAAVTPTRPRPPVVSELLSDVAAVQPGEGFAVAVRLRIQPGWHVYWLNPGDSGLAPRLSWKLSAEVSVGPIQWPVPRGLPSAAAMSYGYEEEVMLLAMIETTRILAFGETVEIGVRADWLACGTGCLRGAAEHALSLPIASGPAKVPSSHETAFAGARRQLPVERPDGISAVYVRTGDALMVVFNLPAGMVVESRDVYFFPCEQGLFKSLPTQPKTVLDRRIELGLQLIGPTVEVPSRLRGVLVLGPGIGDGYAVEATPWQ
ncbi:protein-disulfide reductase DsbD domain-containing protein [Synoicihabitans lomoniglobus]|uniref:Protein-disulfide reductase DsbD family protein n=1 Tax=Synoicihabitans lomoniglobus TaxID=2909285 RepID=A0AAE9ZYV0_9BACT|nr:hypothetical protein [Opitutaceae bacterium LMO-M01]WED65153.1 protein-disulfide reductase DsbD family protein [Opitutaceae bacterium LMO-M01]